MYAFSAEHTLYYYFLFQSHDHTDQLYFITSELVILFPFFVKKKYEKYYTSANARRYNKFGHCSDTSRLPACV